MFHFHKALCTFQDHLRNLHMSLYAFVKIRMINLAINFALQIRDFFRPLVHQQQNEYDFRMIDSNGFRDFFEHDRLSHPGRRDDKTALPASKRSQ